MPLAPNNGNSTSNNVTLNYGPPVTTDTFLAFPSGGNLGGDTIIVVGAVMVGGGAGGAANTQGATVSDSQGNTYTKIFWRDSAFENGPALGIWYANGVRAGANTVKWSWTGQSFNVPGTSTTFNYAMGILEYPATLSPVQAFPFFSNYGQSFPVLNFTDSQSVAVTVPFHDPTTNWTYSVVDFLDGTTDYLIAFGMDSPTPPTFVPTVTPSYYGTFVLEIQASPVPAVTLYVWDQAQHTPPASPLSLACPSSVATLGIAYSSSFVATGGTPPYTFSIIAGALPTGLMLNASTGAVTGTPLATGVFSYTGRVTDNAAATANTACTISVIGGPPPPSSNPCSTVVPQPSTDIQFELKRIYASMIPHKRLPIRGS